MKKTNPTTLWRRLFLLLIYAIFLFGSSFSFAQNTGKLHHYAEFVNPFIGTDFTGNTYPGAQSPFGMVQLSPDNGLPGWDRIAGYFYPDSTIAGFSHTHLLGTGAGDLYDISFLPVSTPIRKSAEPLGVHSRFSHAEEQAEAGYYRVRLSDYDIDVELTATERVGVQRYTFPTSQGLVILNLAKAMNWDRTLECEIRQVDSVTIEGWRFSDGWARNQKVFFRTRFSSPVKSMEFQSDSLFQHGVVHLSFDLPMRNLTVCTALSPVSVEGARKNLEAECPIIDFDRTRRLVQRKWDELLSRIEIQTEKPVQDTIFYTALYHALSAPTIYSDVDGGYRGPDGKVHIANGWTNYSTLSLWDTFRAAHPLYTLICPERVNDFVQSFLAFEKQHGRLPVWPLQGSETDMMIGYHAIPVLVDACLKGLTSANPVEVLEACVRTATDTSYRDIDKYLKYGYIPYDGGKAMNSDDWSLSRTLEYSYDDACIARLARHLGQDSIAKVFALRAQYYKNLYEPVSDFFVPRNSQGQYQADFFPEAYTPHICESNAWQYFWFVPHDVSGLIRLSGGKKAFESKLDCFFSSAPSADDELPLFSTGMIGQYVHGNEPCHHVAYLYNAVGKPEKTQRYLRQIMGELYQNNPAGLCGNEDCGQMSSWYVLSALGFYPVDAADGRYELGAPLFEQAKIHLSSDKSLEIKAPGAVGGQVFRHHRFNGKKNRATYIEDALLRQGGTLEFLP
ncbi:MAG: GH92 family glycosyl hydrolase [Alloprevotella sp.]|nr:GH92 family glycosyl hydrolase [Alloprevotella sp.]